MTNPLQEAESIRFAFDDVTVNSVRALREIIVAQANGWPAPPASLARLIALDDQAYGLRVRNAALNNTSPPVRPAYLDPAPQTTPQT
jgi:hypothetical protein